MSEPINDGGPAFPMQGRPEDRYEGYLGMSLRDWFAGQALAGKCGYEDTKSVGVETLAKEAYRIADAMLKERAAK